MATISPSVRDPEGMRTAILSAAERLFSEKGYAATSVRDLAEASGASKALIHHHFGSKEDLYLAGKNEVMQRYTSAQAPQMQGAMRAAAALREGIRTLFRFYQENPSLVRLGTWTQLEGESARWPHDEELWRRWMELISEAQASGDIRNDVPPAFLLTMAGALAHNWWQFKSSRSHLLQFFPNQDKLDDLYLEYMLKVFFHGAADPTATASSAQDPPALEESPG